MAGLDKRLIINLMIMLVRIICPTTDIGKLPAKAIKLKIMLSMTIYNITHFIEDVLNNIRRNAFCYSITVGQ